LSHTGQVKGDDPNKAGFPGPPDWGCGFKSPSPINTLIVKKLLTIAAGRKHLEQLSKTNNLNYLNLGFCILLRVRDQGESVFNVNIVGLYLIIFL
jgi:hypothetical protein